MIAINFRVIFSLDTLTSLLRMLMENLTIGLEVNSTWSQPKWDSKLNISSSTYLCGIVLLFEKVVKR